MVGCAVVRGMLLLLLSVAGNILRTHVMDTGATHTVRTADTKRPQHWPTVAALRERCDEAIQAKHGCVRATALRRVDLAPSTFDRCLREGVSEDDMTPRVLKKLDALGVLALLPRR